MSNTIKAGFRLKPEIPTSNMVYHENVICTISEHTCDLFFSLPSLEKHLLPMILEDDMGSPVFIFVDQNGEEWIKESDVIRNGMDRLWRDYEFSGLMDDIDATKIKLFGLISREEKLEDVKSEYESIKQNLCLITSKILTSNPIVCPSEDISLSLSVMDKKSIPLTVTFDCLLDDAYIGVGGLKRKIEYTKALISLYEKAATRKGLSMKNRLFLEDYNGLEALFPCRCARNFFKESFEFVYIFKNNDKLMKIGVSSDPYRRLRDFNDIFGLQVESFYLCLKSDVLESSCHKHMASDHVSGEFFNLSGLSKAKEFLRQNGIIEFDSSGMPFACERLKGPIPFSSFNELHGKFIKRGEITKLRNKG